MSELTSAFIGVFGRPNVGKSSLINKILGHKVSIVSDKPQTTRTRIMGVHNSGNLQTVFIDTPGFHKPRNLLGEKMVKAVGNGMTDIDAAVLVVEANPKFGFNPDELPPAELELINELNRRKIPTILCINKIDLLEDKADLFEVISAYTNTANFSAVIPLSAKTGDGIEIVLSETQKFARESVHYFGDDEFTDQPDQVMIGEIIREKILRLLSREVPHGVAIEIERFYERDAADGSDLLCVEASIYCEKDSHKGIIIGKGGSMLKKIGTLARGDIERFFGVKTDLKLWVKVKEDWRNRQGIIHTFGLD